MTKRMDAMINKVEALCESIKPLLAEHPPTVQGAALMNLTALFIAGHHPSVRHEILNLQTLCVAEQTPILAEALFPNGFPEELQ